MRRETSDLLRVLSHAQDEHDLNCKLTKRNLHRNRAQSASLAVGLGVVIQAAAASGSGE